MFDKVKILLIGFGVAAIGGGAGYVAEVDFSQLGTFGPAAGLAIGAALAYFKRERTGYGNGVPVPEDEIPGGWPRPSGADIEA